MVIECPACKTRFALHEGQLAGILNPRFHCSRCGNVFGLTAPHSAEPTYKPSISSELLATHTQAADGDESNEHEQQLSLLPSDQRTSHATSATPEAEVADTDIVKTFTDILEDTPTPAITASWPSGTHDRIYEADMRHALERRLGQSPAASTAQNLIGRWHKLRRDSKSVETLTHAAKSLRAPDPALEGISSFITPPTHTPVPSSPILSFPSRKLTAIIDHELENDRLTHATHKLDARIHHRSPLEFISPVATFCVIPLIFLAGIGLFGDDLVSARPIAHSLARLVPAAEEKAPPAGVYLQKLESQIVTLEDGQRVLEISGKIKNDSPVVVHEIKLETKLFDETNHTLAAQLTHPDNRLADAESLAALRAEALDSLQWERVPGNAGLTPGQERPFRVVFTDSIGDARFYTARIYSVALEN